MKLSFLRDDRHPEPKLSRCPFCGKNQALLIEARTSSVWCHGECWARTGDYLDRDEAVAAWNQRAQDKLVEDLKLEIVQLRELRAVEKELRSAWTFMGSARAYQLRQELGLSQHD